MENRSNADPSKTYKDKSSLAPGTLQAALSESVEKLHETEVLLLRAQLAFQEQGQSKQSGQLRQDHVSWTDLQDVIPNEMNCSHLIDVFFSSVSRMYVRFKLNLINKLIVGLAHCSGL